MAFTNALTERGPITVQAVIGSAVKQVDAIQRVATVAEALTRALDVDQVLEIMLNQGVADTSASGSALSFRHGDAVVVGATFGTTTEAVKRLGGVSVSRNLPGPYAVYRAEPLWLTDRAQALARFPEMQLASPTTRSWAAIPLMSRGRAFGLWSLSFSSPQPFDTPQRLLLLTVADIASLALGQIILEADRARWSSQSQAVLDDLVIDPDDAVVLVGSDGTIIAVNERLLKLLGHTHETLIGRSIEVLLPPSARYEHAQSRQQYVNDPIPRSFGSGLDTVAMHADGTEIDLEISLSPFTSYREGMCVAAVLRPRPGSVS